ncbi:hypothetical protein BC828DRAFT_388262 [Blastocladiella britannica]|nr:hypothetical protein BC828DRAFT_388262 [Blastocladiella britannica]
MPAATATATQSRPSGGGEMDGDGSEIEGPVSSFQSLAAEGDILAKQGEFRKAIDAYTKALNMRPTEKNCLVARSKCYLQLGDADMALQDAESALKEDVEFFKGMYQKAEALYAKGDFEMALVFYHRGNKLRPELDEFRLGIQKAREAIDNSIGNPRDYKFKAPANFSLDATKRVPSSTGSRNPAAKKSAKSEKAGGTGGVTVNTVHNTKKTIPRGESAQPVAPERDVKQLLGELHVDKEYLEQLLDDRDFINNPNDRIFDLVSDALKYLETRTEFWRQQKPIYARRKEAQAIRTKMASARTRQLAREKDREAATSPKSPAAAATGTPGATRSTPPAAGASGGAAGAASPKKPAVGTSLSPMAQFRAIEAAISAGSHKKVVALGKKFLACDLSKIRDGKMMAAHVASSMGTAELELGNMEAAESMYTQALTHAEITPEAQSVTLGNLGRVYAKQQKFALAVQTWEKKLAGPHSIAMVERAWLYHDMARCCIELGEADRAREMADHACQAADNSKEQRWMLNAHVLAGQVYAKSDPVKARENYVVAQALADSLHEEGAASAIAKALDGLGTGDASDHP